MSQGPGYTMSLTLTSWIGTRSINECHQWTAQLGSQIHHTNRFAIAFWPGPGLYFSYTTIMSTVVTLLPDKNNRTPIDISQTCYHRWVITIAAVALQLQEIGRQVTNVIPCCGTTWLTGQVYTYPGCVPGCVGRYERNLVCMHAM